jgi:hypothetical protein
VLPLVCRVTVILVGTVQVIMPQLILSHVTTMDRKAAAFLDAEPEQADFDVLRLPLSGLAE